MCGSRLDTVGGLGRTWTVATADASRAPAESELASSRSFVETDRSGPSDRLLADFRYQPVGQRR